MNQYTVFDNPGISGNYKPTKADKELLRTEYRKVWGTSEKMIDYCTNKVAAMVTLPSGDIITVEKEAIDTHFCYGEHGFDYDEKQSLAHHARTSTDHLKEANMRKFNEWINDLEACYNNGMTDRTPSYLLTITDSYKEKMNVRSLRWVRFSDLLDALGGSAALSDIPGTVFTQYNQVHRVATKEEISIILDLYKFARNNHEKKVDSYIKRYGTSKVKAWTYWADA